MSIASMWDKKLKALAARDFTDFLRDDGFQTLRNEDLRALVDDALELEQLKVAIECVRAERDSWKAAAEKAVHAGRAERLRSAIEDAHGIIHGEFCGSRHHPCCLEVAEVLAADAATQPHGG